MRGDVLTCSPPGSGPGRAPPDSGRGRGPSHLRLPAAPRPRPGPTPTPNPPRGGGARAVRCGPERGGSAKAMAAGEGGGAGAHLPEEVRRAIYGELTPEEKQANYVRSIKHWWTEYAERKVNELEEHPSDTLYYDKNTLPRWVPPPPEAQTDWGVVPPDVRREEEAAKERVEFVVKGE